MSGRQRSASVASSKTHKKNAAKRLTALLPTNDSAKHDSEDATVDFAEIERRLNAQNKRKRETSQVPTAPVCFL